ncbi:MAG: histidine kinase [Lachnospiraceae bacterium]|nr:histidine kinase [Lachnospiraceae bacterium]
MKNILHKLENRIDDYNIKKKFYCLYMACILLPLVITDSIIVYIVIRSERISQYSEMENAANAVKYSLSNTVEQAAGLAKKIYMNKYINEFLDKEYKDAYDYVTSYYNFLKGINIKDIIGQDYVKVTMYSDNDTIINGGGFSKTSRDYDSKWYKYFKETGFSQMLLFDYDDTKSPAIEPKRKLMFIKRLDFFDKKREKILVIEMDYSNMARYLKRMNYPMDIFICWNGKIVLSNGKYISTGKDFEDAGILNQADYKMEMETYGAKFDLYVSNKENTALKEIKKNIPIIIFLVMANAVFPIVMMKFLHKSFTERLGILSDTLRNIDNEEDLVKIENIHGNDEIGSLMSSYNKMAERINTLIKIIYKNKIKEQEMTVARQRAELLALRSQINPHFLFNTLESIRMHSVLRKEHDTADMIEKLAVLERQYVDWGADFASVEEETELVKAYLSIQKYRFGSRLLYEIDIEDNCRDLIIPKLTVVTFVENACVHGIESKTATGWIFVRIYLKDGFMYIEVEDTGKGMDEEAMEQLLWKMRNASIQLLQGKERAGIINACLRLKMETNNEAVFELDGEEGAGLIVQIKIPCKYLGTEGEEC